jgi:hypothetical protein
METIFSLFNISFLSDTLWNNLKQRLIYHIPSDVIVSPLESWKDNNYFFDRTAVVAAVCEAVFITFLIENGILCTGEGRKTYNWLFQYNQIEMRWKKNCLLPVAWAFFCRQCSGLSDSFSPSTFPFLRYACVPMSSCTCYANAFEKMHSPQRRAKRGKC